MNFPELRFKNCVQVLCILYLRIKSHYILYCSLWKSTDLINLENACEYEYFATKSQLVVGQVPPLFFI